MCIRDRHSPSNGPCLGLLQALLECMLLASPCLLDPPKASRFLPPLAFSRLFLTPLGCGWLVGRCLCWLLLRSSGCSRPLHVSSNQLLSCNQRFLASGWAAVLAASHSSSCGCCFLLQAGCCLGHLRPAAASGRLVVFSLQSSHFSFFCSAKSWHPSWHLQLPFAQMHST